MAKKLKKPADGSMTIVEHINELRKRVFIALVAIFIGTIIGYIWYNVEVGPIPSLGEVLRGPYCNLPPEARFGSEAGQCRLLATGPFEMFMLRLKVGALAGMVFSSPIWLGQIWAYITPGLHKNEKRWTLGVGISAGLLFTVGAVLAYFVLSYGLEFLLTIGDEAQIAALNGERYFSFAMALLLIFGVSFEVPLITVLLNLANVVSYQQLKDKRRFIWAFLFLFAAFVTPGQDPISMVILAISLCAMMEIATQIARLNDRRRKNNQEEWLELDDEEGSDTAAPQPIKPVTATAAPQSTSAARPINEPKRQDPKAQTFTNSNFDDIL